MTSLIERLEAATGPDRELDAEIAILAGGLPHGEHFPRPDGSIVSYLPDKPKHITRSKHYTASLDDALTLVPEGWDWTLDRVNDGLTISARCGTHDQFFGATPAIALTIAALKARGIE